MIENIHRIREEAQTQIRAASNSQVLEQLRVHYLGKKGIITSLLHQLKGIEASKKRTVGALLNELKHDLEVAFENYRLEAKRASVDQLVKETKPIDVTLPGTFPHPIGSFHPVSRIIDQIVDALRRVGFSSAFGPEVELEYYNFEALNTPADHPARDLQDTFYIDGPILLRSHTSPVQIRAMKAKAPPLQILSVGKVYRSDYDITHTPMFHQVEGFLVDENISLSDLKGVLSYLVKNLFGSRQLRFRPSFFPFTEPSAEVDMQCIQCKGSGKDCRLCSSSGWLEIGGCGMIHPNVFKAVGYSPDRYTGFAFGMGVERIAMLKYGIDDLRSFFENDYRMLEQF